MSEHISQREAARAVATVENTRERASKQKFMLSEVVGAAAASFGVGYLETKNPELKAGWFGGKVKLDHVIAVGGIIAGRKSTRSSAIARGAGLGALGRLSYNQGVTAAT